MASTTWQLLLLQLSGFKGAITKELKKKWDYSMIPNKNFERLRLHIVKFTEVFKVRRRWFLTTCYHTLTQTWFSRAGAPPGVAVEKNFTSIFLLICSVCNKNVSSAANSEAGQKTKSFYLAPTKNHSNDEKITTAF